MELDSKAHNQLIIASIIKISIKTIALGLVMGLILIAPIFLRENSFSVGLYYAGIFVIFSSTSYALFVAAKKFLIVRNSLQED